MLAEGRSGIVKLQDGVPKELRLSRQGDLVTVDGQGRYYEAARVGTMFSLVLTATTTGVAAGNIVGAAAAAATQFALINPLSSQVNLQLLRFGLGVISGTAGIGPIFHGYIPNAGSISAGTPGGTIRSNLMGQSGASVAVPWSLAAGSALTGGQAPVTHRIAFTSATVATPVVEDIAGDLIVPPGTAWLPLWSAAGTTLLNGYSISWSEIPL